MSTDQYISNYCIPPEAYENIRSQGFYIRELELNDFHKGFLKVLGMLTSVGSLTFGQFIGIFK